MPNDNTTIRPFVSALIDRFIPEHIRENHPKFVQFIQAYLEFLETSHRAGYFQNTLQSQRNLELQEEEFLSRIEKEIGFFVPEKYAATPRVFYNQITDLWKAKGSEEGIKLFFRLFLNEIVEIRFPWDKVLKPSDGKWIIDKRLRVSMIRGNPNDFLNEKIIQIEGYAVATVTKIEKKNYGDGVIYELSLLSDRIIGEFIPRNRITTQNSNIDIEAEIYSSPTNIKILDGGQGYSIGERIRIPNRSRVSFEARISAVEADTGKIQEISIVDFGSGSTPNHIIENEESAIILRNFNVFDYPLVGGRVQTLGDSIDFKETVDIFRQDYAADFNDQFLQTLGENVDLFESVTGFQHDYTKDFYFSENYLANDSFEKNQDSLVVNPIPEQPPFIQFPNITEIFFDEEYVRTAVTSESQDSNIINLVVSTENIDVRFTDDIPPPDVEILTQNGTGAILKLDFGSIVETTGYYSGVFGQLSESIVLQDSKFFQKFSYEVISRFSIEQWIDPLKKTVHPAGVNPLSLVTTTNELIPRPEFVLFGLAILLLPESPVKPFSGLFYKFTKVLSNQVGFESDTSLEFTKTADEDFVGVAFEKIKKEFTKGLNNKGIIDDLGTIKDFTKILGYPTRYSINEFQEENQLFAEDYTIFKEFYSDTSRKYFAEDYTVTDGTVTAKSLVEVEVEKPFIDNVSVITSDVDVILGKAPISPVKISDEDETNYNLDRQLGLSSIYAIESLEKYFAEDYTFTDGHIFVESKPNYEFTKNIGLTSSYAPEYFAEIYGIPETGIGINDSGSVFLTSYCPEYFAEFYVGTEQPFVKIDDIEFITLPDSNINTTDNGSVFLTNYNTTYFAESYVGSTTSF